MTDDFDPETHLAALAAAAGVPIPEPCRAGVVANLRVAHAMARRVFAVELGAHETVAVGAFEPSKDGGRESGR